MSFADIDEDETDKDDARTSASTTSSGQPAPEDALLSRVPTSNVTSNAAVPDRSAQPLGTTADKSAKQGPGGEHQPTNAAQLAHGLDASLQDGAATREAAGPAAAAEALAADPAAAEPRPGGSGTVQM
jgi:hypothetical protein